MHVEILIIIKTYHLMSQFIYNVAALSQTALQMHSRSSLLLWLTQCSHTLLEHGVDTNLLHTVSDATRQPQGINNLRETADKTRKQS